MGIIVTSFIVTAFLASVGFYFLFRKTGSGINPLKNPKYWLTTILGTPIIYFGLLFAWLLISSSYESKKFIKKDWAENTESRYEYVDDLIKNEKLIGLSRIELNNMLGESDYEDDSTMTFYIGYSPRPLFNMDPDWLVTELVEGKARNVYVRE